MAFIAWWKHISARLTFFIFQIGKQAKKEKKVLGVEKKNWYSEWNSRETLSNFDVNLYRVRRSISTAHDSIDPRIQLLNLQEAMHERLAILQLYN